MAYCSAELILSASLLTAMLHETSALLRIRELQDQENCLSTIRTHICVVYEHLDIVFLATLNVNYECVPSTPIYNTVVPY